MTKWRDAAAAIGIAAAIALVAGADRVQSRQVRDRAADPVGQAAIAGVVTTDADEPVPLRRAIVTASGGGLSSSRSAITDDEGRFVITRLPAGRYTIAAAKPAYLTAAYGARRPGRAGTALILTEGQQADIGIRMSRGAAVEGVIRDEDGQPVPGVDVYALNARNPAQVGLRLNPGDDVSTTDDQGRYRIYGLAPGQYVIAAAVAMTGAGTVGRRREAEIDAIIEAARRRATTPGAAYVSPEPAPAVGYPLTFYPGVPAFAMAGRLDLAAGDDRAGLDFSLVPVAVASVEGVVLRGDGLSPSAVSLSLHVDGPRAIGAGTAPVLAQAPDALGRFRYAGLAPGRYTLYARAETGPPPAVPAGGRGSFPPPPPPPPRAVSSADTGTRPQYAVAEFEVTGQDVSGLTLVLQPGATLTGRAAFDAASAPPPATMSGLTVRVALPSSPYMSRSGGTMLGTSLVSLPPVSPNADGTFAVRGIAPGRYRFSVTVPPSMSETWWLRSAMLDGRDLLDVPLEVGSTDLDGVVLTFTDRRTELAGSFQSAAGLPAPEYFVVVFPADRGSWQTGSRRIRSTRPDTAGNYSIADLPPGEYLLAALTDLEPRDLEDEQFLSEMAAQAVAITIAEGERTVQNLRVAR